MKEKTLRAAYQRPEAEIFLLELGTSVLDKTSPCGEGPMSVTIEGWDDGGSISGGAE